MPELLPSWEKNEASSLRDFAHIKLIVADLDGSFVHASSSSVYDALKDLQRTLSHPKYQVALTVATGRTLFGARPLIDSVAIPRGMPIILYNGSLILENRTFGVIRQEVIESAAIGAILRVCASFDVTVLVYIFRNPVEAGFRMDPVEVAVGWSRAARYRYDFNGIEVNWRDSFHGSEDLNASAVLIDITRCSGQTAELASELTSIPTVACTKSGRQFLEVRPQGSDKGVALKAAAAFLRLDPSEILALGDNDNDAEMLSSAGIGVAVSGASGAALSASRYVCHYGAAEGAIEVMRLVKHARRFFFRPHQQPALRHY